MKSFRLGRVVLGVCLGITLTGITGCGQPSGPPAPKPGGLVIGDRAVDFNLMDQSGQMVKMADVQPGWYLVLVFYRGSWCSSCQNQLINLKGDYPKFSAVHATLAAVSTDPVEDSAQFNQVWRFPYPLLSDTKLELIDQYGLRHPQEHDGKDISHPAVVIIDPQKIVRYKYVGKNASDRPADDEIIFNIQQMQTGK